MKCAIYARVSTEEQVNGTSLDNQIATLENWAKIKGVVIYRNYIDKGVSGTTDKREEFQKMMIDAKATRFDIVAVSKMDRFMRNTRLFFDYIDDLRKGGVTFVSVDESLDTSTPTGLFTLQILGTIAQWERDRILERTKAGRVARLTQGKWPAGNALYGYKYNSETKFLEIDADTAAVVKRIFNLYIFDRFGYEKIARLLNKDGIKPKRKDAQQWNSSAVQAIINHPAYKGEHHTGAKVPAIVELEIWNLGQQRRKSNPHLHNRTNSPWLLQSLIKCGLCGHVLSCSFSHGKQRRVYSCRGRLQQANTDNSDKCTLPILDAEWLEQKVTESIKEAFADPRSLLSSIDVTIEKLTSKKSVLEKSVYPVQDKLKILYEKKRKLSNQYVQEDLTDAEFSTMREKINDEIERAENIGSNNNPDEIKELERTRTWLEFWTKNKAVLSHRINLLLEGTDDGQLQDRTQLIQKFFLDLVGADNSELTNMYGIGSPTSTRQLLEYLNTSIVAFPDRIEINGLIPVKDIAYQDYNAVYRIARCRRSG
jgi:site-specific DNA recombinase